jgi:hypothetical protein
MIEEFILLRKKAHEICQMFHEMLPEHYEDIDIEDISISLNFIMDNLQIRDNNTFNNILFIEFPVEWLSLPNYEIKALIIKIYKLYNYNES